VSTNLTVVNLCVFFLSPSPQLGGSFLLGVGVWVVVDPTGFREIVAANPLLFTGVYIILAMGGMLFLLGFLGCCGAIRENKCLLLFVSHEDNNTEPIKSVKPCVCTLWLCVRVCDERGDLQGLMHSWGKFTPGAIGEKACCCQSEMHGEPVQ